MIETKYENEAYVNQLIDEVIENTVMTDHNNNIEVIQEAGFTMTSWEAATKQAADHKSFFKETAYSSNGSRDKNTHGYNRVIKNKKAVRKANKAKRKQKRM